LSTQRRTWICAILPIGLLFSFSLALSNIAYVFLNVSFVQMLKVSARIHIPALPQSLNHTPPIQAFIPVLVHLISTAIGIASEFRCCRMP
jgi:hypothetical protein